jgi:hypothetical protein
MEHMMMPRSAGIDLQELISRLIKYLVEGSAVAVAAYVFPQKKLAVKEVVMVALTAAAVFAILDLFAPSVGASARQGAGFAIGANTVGFGGISLPGGPSVPGVPQM